MFGKWNKKCITIKHNVQIDVNPRMNSCWFSILKSNHLKEKKGRKSCTFAVDTEKTFDIIYHPFKTKNKQNPKPPN